MQWTNFQKINMQSLLDELEEHAKAKRKPKLPEGTVSSVGGHYNAGRMIRKSPEEYLQMFFSKIDIQEANQCWEWKAFLMKNGYGQINLRNKCFTAHRISFFLENGFFPPHDTCHSCDNRKCVNPNHLRAGTRSENMQDCLRRGRMVLPAIKRKLSEQQVREIRILSGPNQESASSMARRYGVSKDTIINIRNWETWRAVK